MAEILGALLFVVSLIIGIISGVVIENKLKVTQNEYWIKYSNAVGIALKKVEIILKSLNSAKE
jgi:hypothetical protein